MAQLLKNNAYSTLGASLTNVATSLTVETATGDRFPAVTAPDFVLLTLQDAGNNIEIIKVTARTSGSDSMTIERAQEGTAARAWNLGDVVELRVTAALLKKIGQVDASQPGVISVNSSSDALKITQAGSGNALYIEDVAADATPFVVSSTGVVGVGTLTPDSVTSAGIALVSNTGFYPQLVTRNKTADTNAGYQVFDKDRAGAIVQNGDVLGNIVFRGYDGSAYHQAAAIMATVGGTPGANDMPGDLVFLTTRDGQNSPTEALRLRADGVATGLTVNAINGGQLAGLRNKVINGNFGINQRNYVSGAATTAGQYTLDRWKVTGTGGVTFSTTANKTTVTIPSGQTLQQVIEGLNLESGTYVLSWEGTAQGRIAGGSYGASGAVTASITGGTNTTIEFNTGTVALVMLEKGTVATPFEHRPYGMELALCQRYYYRIVSSVASAPFATGILSTTTLSQIFFNLPVESRIPFTGVEVALTSLFDVATTESLTVSDVVYVNATKNMVALQVTNGSGTAGQAARFRGNSGAYIGFTGAEL